MYTDNTAGMSFLVDAAGPITFNTNTTERMRIDSSGNVGIGTSSPVTNSLTVTRAIGQGNLALLSSTTPTSNQRLFFIGAGSETDTGKARIGFETGEAWTAGVSTPTRMYFTTTPSGSTANAIRMLIDADGNVGIGTTSPNASALLDVQSTTKGVRMPNMTTTQKNAISSPAAGLMVFDTTLAKLSVYSGTAWQTVTST
jgi:hypothetical protein